MTTKDAPVTVEQCDRTIANDVLERSFEEGRMLTIRDLVLIAKQSRKATEDRLAALASAPAEDGVEDDPDHQYAVVSANYFRPFLVGAYPTLEAGLLAQGGKPERWHIYHRAALARPHSFVAPAGDEEWLSFVAGVQWTADQNIGMTLERDEVKSLAAALAHPRAAVGEQSREAIARAAADGCDDEYPDGRRARDGEKWWCAYDGAMRALALQSPPAKVDAA